MTVKAIDDKDGNATAGSNGERTLNIGGLWGSVWIQAYTEQKETNK